MNKDKRDLVYSLIAHNRMIVNRLIEVRDHKYKAADYNWEYYTGKIAGYNEIILSMEELLK